MTSSGEVGPTMAGSDPAFSSASAPSENTGVMRSWRVVPSGATVASPRSRLSSVQAGGWSGAIDGSFSTAESVASLRLDKAIRHRTSVPGGLYNTSFAFVMNQAVWERIPKNDQAAIERVSGEHAAALFGRAWDRVDRQGVALMQASGVRTTIAGKAFVDALRARTAPLERKWIVEARAQGLAGPEQVLREFRAEAAKLP